MSPSESDRGTDQVQHRVSVSWESSGTGLLTFCCQGVGVSGQSWCRVVLGRSLVYNEDLMKSCLRATVLPYTGGLSEAAGLQSVTGPLFQKYTAHVQYCTRPLTMSKSVKSGRI